MESKIMSRLDVRVFDSYDRLEEPLCIQDCLKLVYFLVSGMRDTRMNKLILCEYICRAAMLMSGQEIKQHP